MTAESRDAARRQSTENQAITNGVHAFDPGASLHPQQRSSGSTDLAQQPARRSLSGNSLEINRNQPAPTARAAPRSARGVSSRSDDGLSWYARARQIILISALSAYLFASVVPPRKMRSSPSSPPASVCLAPALPPRLFYSVLPVSVSSRRPAPS